MSLLLCHPAWLHQQVIDARLPSFQLRGLATYQQAPVVESTADQGERAGEISKKDCSDIPFGCRLPCPACFCQAAAGLGGALDNAVVCGLPRCFQRCAVILAHDP